MVGLLGGLGKKETCWYDTRLRKWEGLDIPCAMAWHGRLLPLDAVQGARERGGHDVKQVA